ncbi:hypothetical protein N7470_005197 [Penicillium chermesinum]|nr:hypothetical protein N7470_005197 [Penicillium chermesinum]
MSSEKKIIAVVGATGTQGSSVARTFLSLSNWHVRALTRNPTSDKSTELKSLGAEVVQADLDDKGSLEAAFAGAHAIFLNTDFWQPYRKIIATGADPEASGKQAYEIEVNHGKNAAIVAAGISTLQRFVYSALGPMKAASGGKYPHSRHWETKASIVEYIQAEQPELAKKTSFIYIGAYITNRFLYPKFDAETKEFSYVIPGGKDLRMPIIDTAKSTGPFVRTLIEDEEAGTKLLAYDDYQTTGNVAKTFSRALGKEIKVYNVGMQELHEKTGAPLEVLSGPAFLSEFDYCAGISNVIEPDQLKNRPSAPTFSEWLSGHDVLELIGLKKSNN